MNVHKPRDFTDRRQLVNALRSLRRGDFSVRLPEDDPSFDSEIATLFNEVVGLNQEITGETQKSRALRLRSELFSQRLFGKNESCILRIPALAIHH